MLAIIVVCEVLFWVMLVLGLLARYVARWRTVSTILLISTPIIDLVLIAITMIDLGRGSTPHFTHGLSAFYIGFSVVFGPSVIRWADQKANYRWGDGPEPVSVDRSPSDELAHQWSEWRRALVASAIAAAVLVSCIAVAGFGKSFWLLYWLIVLVFLVACWALLGPWKAARRTKNTQR